MDLATVRRVTRALDAAGETARAGAAHAAAPKTVSVWCGTYNVNGKKEQALALSHWLKQGWASDAPQLFCVSLRAGRYQTSRCLQGAVSLCAA